MARGVLEGDSEGEEGGQQGGWGLGEGGEAAVEVLRSGQGTNLRSKW